MPRAINRLNVYPVPDGDTGTNMARTLDAVVAELDRPAHELEPTCNAISHGCLMGARGNSGVILSQILRGWSATLKGAPIVTATKVADGAEGRVGRRLPGGAEADRGHDPHRRARVGRRRRQPPQPRAPASSACCGPPAPPGKTALDNTPELLPVLKEAGVVDAGGAGFLLLLDAALHVVDGEPLPEPDEGDGPTAEQLAAGVASPRVDGGVDVSELRYEVMYFLDLADERIQDVQGSVGRDRRLDRGRRRRRPLELPRAHQRHRRGDRGRARLGGRPQQIRVTDLFEEVAEEHAVREAAIRRRPTPRRRGRAAGR